MYPSPRASRQGSSPNHPASVDYSAVLYRRHGPVAEISLNRPHVLNALNRQTDLDLAAALSLAAADDTVRAVVLAGEGRAFCAGADLKERAAEPPAAVETIMEEGRRGLVFTRLWQMDKPTIAAIHGYCLAGGHHLAAMCDAIVAGEGARFGEPEVRFGNPLLMPAIPLRLGHKRARELLYTGDMITAEQALELGLVERVVPDERVREEARTLALILAGVPGPAIQAQKRALRFADDRRGFKTGVRSNLEILALTLALQPHLAGDTAEVFLRTAREQGLKAAVQQRDAPFEEARATSQPGHRGEAARDMQTYRWLTYQPAADGIIEITLNRPGVLNALNRELCAELDDALERAAATPDLRAVILAGNGRAFSAGMDLKEPDEEPMSEQRERRHLRRLMERCVTLWDYPVPVIAAVHGYVLGHACDLAAAADFTIAAEGTMFGVPEIRHGGGVAGMFYPYTGGMKGMRLFLLTGQPVDAAEAQRLGLVSQVVAADRLQSAARLLAERLAAIPPDALRQMKRAINRSYEMMGLRESLEYNLEALILSHLAQPASHWEARENLIATQGLKAFLRQRDQSANEGRR